MITDCCHEGKQQPELTTDSEVKSQRWNFFLPCFVYPYLDIQKTEQKNIFPRASLMNINLSVQAVCALSRDVTSFWFLPPAGTSQGQWSDEAMSVNKMWLLHLLQDMFILLQIFFVIIYDMFILETTFLLLYMSSFFACHQSYQSLLGAIYQFYSRYASLLASMLKAASTPAGVKGRVGNAWSYSQLSYCELGLIP